MLGKKLKALELSLGKEGLGNFKCFAAEVLQATNDDRNPACEMCLPRPTHKTADSGLLEVETWTEEKDRYRD